MNHLLFIQHIISVHPRIHASHTVLTYTHTPLLFLSHTHNVIYIIQYSVQYWTFVFVDIRIFEYVHQWFQSENEFLFNYLIKWYSNILTLNGTHPSFRIFWNNNKNQHMCNVYIYIFTLHDDDVWWWCNNHKMSTQTMK